MKLVCISDTHNYLHRQAIPDGDVLIHCGDFSSMGLKHEIERFASLMRMLPHKHKIVVAGNHDIGLQTRPEYKDLLFGLTYLEESGVEIDGIKFWRSPYTPQFYNWAFMYPRDQNVWGKIPIPTDVLITHGPPFGILDRNLEGQNCGCPFLRDAVFHVKPAVHVFGHIHEGYGEYEHLYPDGMITRFINPSWCDRHYRPINPPKVFEIVSKK